MVGSKVGSAIGGSILSASLGGMTDGVINSMYKDIKKSGNKLEEDKYNNTSGSDYNTCGCNYNN
ncbi:hypothetical protein AP460_02789 [Actinobacillus pleuropneumoniae]|uniref:hypothetical protein n=1 Tax=Actinobacillus pleuropneumoniae TaxID=715 RepID=UPI0005920038|nr:hypothetical protein [Actinobacillus pleuropneumoniae]KIE90532.1 hypothetical protein AP518_02899 [Actinobacillus pleuropneumoniae]KIE90748.1 hypothetical protein AP460_02789 [Actinobacillus pleuropneumoniae]KIE90751.1 hypothetical protein AP1022_02802 [Actinobacillus pleuropneumoniae]KIE96328.1 hypothetical protein AP5651_02910 [Actinobacillus pleuropneumoniae]KIE97303.1 hypothetical protein AP780_02854 [Actinobacillus pleuropneumoniae]